MPFEIKFLIEPRSCRHKADQQSKHVEADKYLPRSTEFIQWNSNIFAEILRHWKETVRLNLHSYARLILVHIDGQPFLTI